MPRSLRTDSPSTVRIGPRWSRHGTDGFAEWLLANGQGGYAALTVVGCPTRRQHGLLVAPYAGQPQRHVFLQRFEERLHVGDREVPLSIARYPGLYAPHGHATLNEFTSTPWPKSVHQIGTARLVREIFVPHGPASVLVRYRWLGAPGPARLDLEPLLPCRPADALTEENPHLRPRSDVVPDGVRWQPYPELPPLFATVHGATFTYRAAPRWNRRVEYPVDLERGYPGHEDVFVPGTLSLTLVPGHAAVVAVSLGAAVAAPRRTFRRASRPLRPGLRGTLEIAADAYVATLAGRTTVIAGFPWFGEWGRDTFLCLPGLWLARGRIEEGGDVLQSWAPLLRDGLLPNRFDDRGRAEYTCADASLWFALALHRYDAAGGDPARLREVFLPALRALVGGIAAGNPIVSETDDGLPFVHHPAPDEFPVRNPTWMDARVNGRPVVARTGVPVEIAALWVRARATLADLEDRFGSRAAARDARRKARRAANTFVARFAAEPGRVPPDVVDPAPDAGPLGLRPNVVLAAAVPQSPLPIATRRAIVRAAEDHLLTPFGLRTLAPDHPAYEGRYEGDEPTRDRAYHQGTAWPWLLGPYVEATLAAFGRATAQRGRLQALLDGLAPLTKSAGLGHLPEVVDGDPPHRPGGAFAQAMSVAEVLRAYALLDPPPRRRRASRGRPTPAS